MEGVSEKKAQEMTVSKVVETCRRSAQNDLVKTVLAAGSFANSDEVLAKFSMEIAEQAKDRQVLAYQKRSNNNRNFHQGDNHPNYNGNSNRNYNGNGNTNYNGNGNRNYNGNRNNNDNFRNRNNNANFFNRNNNNDANVRVLNEDQFQDQGNEQPLCNRRAGDLMN